MEERASYYYKQLMASKKPQTILTNLFCELFDLTPDASYFIMFSKLIKLYGREAVFNALLDIYGIENLNLNNLYPLFNSICKKYAISQVDVSKNLLDELTEVKKQKKKPNKIGDPFGD